jgi:hypothetical protein
MGNLTNEQVQGFAGDIMGNSVPPAIMEAQAQGAATQFDLLEQAAEARGFDIEVVDEIITTAIRAGHVDPETLAELSPEDLVLFAEAMQPEVQSDMLAPVPTGDARENQQRLREGARQAASGGMPERLRIPPGGRQIDNKGLAPRR